MIPLPSATFRESILPGPLCGVEKESIKMSALQLAKTASGRARRNNLRKSNTAFIRYL
jgi:hypothetical protein